MVILALDTTSRAGSVALLRDDTLVESRTGDPSRSHGQRLPGDLLRLLDNHDLIVRDVDLYGVAVGPGSFTGLRVGIATVQGLAFANRRPVVPVSALAALGALADTDATGSACELTASLIDAGRREIFATLFRRRVAAGGGPCRATLEHGVVMASQGFESVGESIVIAPAQLAAEWADRIGQQTVWAVGSGAVTYRDVTGALAPGVRIADEVPPLAAAIARVAAQQWRAGTAVAPHAVHPCYVRRPDVELARNR